MRVFWCKQCRARQAPGEPPATDPIRVNVPDFAELVNRDVDTEAFQPAGMEAARVAALRGHEVQLFEQGATLGGLINYAATPDFKGRLRRYTQWFAEEIQRLGVEIHCNHAVEENDPVLEKADHILFATGSNQIKPGLPGIDGKNVIDILAAHDLAKQGAIKADRILVAGGGLSGCDFALEMAKEGKQVTIVEMVDAIAQDVFMINRISMNRMMEAYQVDVRVRHRITEFSRKASSRRMVKPAKP